MPYKIAFHSRFERDFKQFKKNKPARQEISEQIERVMENPNVGIGYGGNLAGLMKLSFGSHPQYRLIYRVYECCHLPADAERQCSEFDTEINPPDCQGLIDFQFIKTREECNNLYNYRKTYFDDTLRDGFNLMPY